MRRGESEYDLERRKEGHEEDPWTPILDWGEVSERDRREEETKGRIDRLREVRMTRIRPIQRGTRRKERQVT